MSTRLNGFTEDYDELLFWIDDSSPETLANKINEIDLLSNNDLEAVADSARKYLLNNKTWKMNAQKVHDYLMEIEKKVN